MSPAFDVLFLCQRLPWPPDRGDRITTWNICSHLCDRGLSVRVACFVEGPADEPGRARLRELGVTLATARLRPWHRRLACLPRLLTGEPLTLPWFRSRRLATAVSGWLDEGGPRVALAYSSSMGQYLLREQARLAGARKLMHFAELDSDKWRQYAARSRWPASWVYAREARLLLGFERRLAAAMDRNLVVSEVERDLFAERIPGIPVEVLPNGVDLERFRPGDPDRREPATLIFTGVMDYHPNVDAVLHFASTVWPRIRAARPEARFLVVGSQPTAEVRALAGRDGIEVTGRVPETRPWFERASVAVVPLRIARGIQNKVLEAMAMGLPVVATSRAFSGIEAEPGRDLVLADDDDAFTTAVLALLDDPARRAALGAAARAVTERSYAWAEVLRPLDAWLDEA